MTLAYQVFIPNVLYRVGVAQDIDVVDGETGSLGGLGNPRATIAHGCEAGLDGRLLPILRGQARSGCIASSVCTGQLETG